MRKATLINHLNALDDDEIRNEILILYDRFKVVKDYYAMELGNEKERTKLFVKAKKNIKAKYETKALHRPKRPRISKINKILSEMEKVSIFKEEMADLYLYNCECAIEFILYYQFHSQPLHNTVTNSFKKACLGIAQSSSIADFKERCHNIVDRSFDVYEHLGYTVQDIFYKYLKEN